MLTRKEQAKQLREWFRVMGFKPITVHDLHYEGTTTCLAYDPGTDRVVARGLAIKSPADQTHYNEGIVRAMARARRAIQKEKNSEPIQTSRYQGTREHYRYRDLAELYDYKSTFSCRLTSEEQKLVKEFKEKVTDA